MGALGTGIPKPLPPSLLHLPPSSSPSSPFRFRLLYSRTLKTPAAAAAATASASYSTSTRSRTISKSTRGRSSLYPRPSLREIAEQRASNRAEVYSFLRGLGIRPDELDGLELPVTVDVMRERVDFLLSLGLTVDDINSYPLLLGCSVKKNMLPVLHFLGSLGVRTSSLPDLLRRYPHVLHSSVAVDLSPVVNYLKGMDIRPLDLPRVIERYPELLGFKIEGTMSTSVAYLVAIGVSRRQIGRLLTKYPEILGMRVGRVIKPLVDYLESLGLPRPSVARIIEEKPFVLGFDLRDRVRPNVDALLRFHVGRGAIASVVSHYPEILGLELHQKLAAQRSLLGSVALMSQEDFGLALERMPQLVSLGQSAILKHMDFLKKCGFSLKQVNDMVVKCPQLLALNLDIMRKSFDYFQEEMERELEDLVEFPAFFTYGLESTIKPRHNIVSEKGLKCSLRWLLDCSDGRFRERMSYDTIGIEEIEPKLSFVDMENAISEAREEEEDDDNFLDSDDEGEDTDGESI